jgi:hypothetical protein
MARPEVFVSIDIESDGPAPGLYSMLALGAAAFLPRSDGDGTAWEEAGTWYATLFRLEGAQQHPDTMAWWKTQPDAWAEVHRGRRSPELAIPEFAAWCEQLPGKPVAMAWPVAFDFAFPNYYCHRFAGRNPLGFGGGDIRSYANGLARHPAYYGISEEEVRAMSGPVETAGLRDHVAVDDAIGQGRLFMGLRRAAILAGRSKETGGLR